MIVLVIHVQIWTNNQQTGTNTTHQSKTCTEGCHDNRKYTNLMFASLSPIQDRYTSSTREFRESNIFCWSSALNSP